MGESLNPTALSRLIGGLRPDWSRTMAARRVAAGALVVLAAISGAALRPRRRSHRDRRRRARPGTRGRAHRRRCAPRNPHGDNDSRRFSVGRLLGGRRDTRRTRPPRRDHHRRAIAGPAAGRIGSGPQRQDRAVAPRRHGATGPDPRRRCGRRARRHHLRYRRRRSAAGDRDRRRRGRSSPRSRRGPAAAATGWSWWRCPLTPPTRWRARLWCRRSRSPSIDRSGSPPPTTAIASPEANTGLRTLQDQPD